MSWEAVEQRSHIPPRSSCYFHQRPKTPDFTSSRRHKSLPYSRLSFVRLLFSLQYSVAGNPRAPLRPATEPESRVVSKPVPESQAQDPRTYHIEQLKKRYSPTEAAAPDGSTSLAFKLRPSDPDFPFELIFLDCDLRIPQEYPESRPGLRIRNSNIPRGFSINIERGWERLASERRDATLLSLVNALDRNLERFLSEQKVETVKLVAFKDTRHIDAASPPPVSAASSTADPPKLKPQAKPYFPEESFTREQISEAKARRAQEVRQLEARLGGLSRFRRSADGVVFTVPIEPKRRSELWHRASLRYQLTFDCASIVPAPRPPDPAQRALGELSH
ncbi:hypothetical protein HIM_09460 [Hirsutella minnesotensis 3608]|uniref:RWD domain-containing protein n=1 Tax=Hirsutella minnesotensis 3608 TaxID=1043627 RepID=A0A0F7ZGM7_9HYPO|nr:hypothetical protein HIM_09460 [Hirsutella minnesotensis 3608]